MAEKPSSPVSNLADLVTCSICLAYFKDARALPCLHSYCKECLQDLVTPEGKIICPHCRLEVHVPDGDVSNLNSNFFVNNVLDALNSATRAASEERQETNPSISCKIHPEKECELFCEHCSKLICYKCISNWGTCGQHKYESIETTVKVRRKNVEDFLQKQEEFLPSVKKHLEVLEDMKIKQAGKVFEVNQQISDTFAKHSESLKKREEMLLKQAFDLHDRGLSSEVDRVQVEQAKIENTIEFCRKILDVDDPALFLEKYVEVKDEMFQTDTPNLVSDVELGSLHFQATDSLLADVISNFGNVVAHETDAAKDDKQFQSTSKEKRLPTSESQSIKQQPARPTGQHPILKPQAAATVGPVTWKLYNKSHSDLNVTFQNEGLAVTTKSLKNVAVIGKPGFQRGKHSWKIKVTGFSDGLGIGVCVGTGGRGIVVTYDSGFDTILKMETHINVELDCKAKILSILPDVYRLPDVIGFENPTSCEIHPYFYLPGSGKTTHNQIAIVSMDGKVVGNYDSSCCMM